MTTVEANEQSVLDGGADETERALAHNVAEDGDRAPCFSARAAAEVLGELEAAGTSLARELSQLTTVWRDVMQESSESAVDHLLLYDSAAMDLEAKSIQAVELGEKLVHSSSTLNSELRSMDILAARVKAVKLALDELESLVKPLLK
uniref:BLOC-1-related complex subunit 6 C-terminal helix domain-containing protein n=1 Tax=Tetraselmis chuii TaxID=63592 RepID=A0A7S1SPE5_9CHLO|mmetsp:Transcript_2259/g.3971  ORF Transcript_2259/g.3971 Transcript_2259/m.3971 type:complete len:147 (+) Transcript_2259:234-674(+)